MLYRVPGWLSANNLVDRICGADGVWRFSTNAGAGADRVPFGGRRTHIRANVL